MNLSASANEPAPEDGLAGRLKRALSKLNIFALWRRVDEVERGFHDELVRRFEESEQIHNRIEQRLDVIEHRFRELQAELEALRDARVEAIEGRCDDLESEIAVSVQRDAELSGRHDHGEQALRAVGVETQRLRDQVVPAAVRRFDALLERIMAEVQEVGSLVDRLLLGEPLPAPALPSAGDQSLATALNAIHPRLVEAFRGDEDEVHHRMERYLEELSHTAPVLDLGCGRGELLLLLREAGVSATGVERDPALLQAARRRGLEVLEGDVLEVLEAGAEASFGAVTAFHLFEHLEPARLVATLAEVYRVLRPGGVLVVEGPNPGSIRVAASLHWLDPTHQHPLHHQTLEVFLKAAGFEVRDLELLHPFPDEQLFSGSSQPQGEVPADLADVYGQLDSLRRRLDDLLNGERDFAVRAFKPQAADAS